MLMPIVAGRHMLHMYKLHSSKNLPDALSQLLHQLEQDILQNGNGTFDSETRTDTCDSDSNHDMDDDLCFSEAHSNKSGNPSTVSNVASSTKSFDCSYSSADMQ